MRILMFFERLLLPTSAAMANGTNEAGLPIRHFSGITAGTETDVDGADIQLKPMRKPLRIIASSRRLPAQRAALVSGEGRTTCNRNTPDALLN